MKHSACILQRSALPTKAQPAAHHCGGDAEFKTQHGRSTHLLFLGTCVGSQQSDNTSPPGINVHRQCLNGDLIAIQSRSVLLNLTSRPPFLPLQASPAAGHTRTSVLQRQQQRLRERCCFVFCFSSTITTSSSCPTFSSTLASGLPDRITPQPHMICYHGSYPALFWLHASEVRLGWYRQQVEESI